MGKSQHIRDLAHELYLESIFDGSHIYALNQGPDEFQRFGAYCSVLKRLVKVLDLAPEEKGTPDSDVAGA